MEPKVSIILLNWNSGEVTKDCIASLHKTNYQNYEIVVVDNGSVDGSDEELASKFHNIVLLKNKMNMGFAGGNNIGIKYALASGADYVLILNNDTIVNENFLSEMVKIALKNESCGMVTGKIYYHDNPEIIWYAGGIINKFTLRTKHLGQNERENGKYSEISHVSFISGCCMLVKKSLIEKIGAFDERFFAYAEDLDWSLRAIKAGYNLVYVPSAKLWHKVSVTVKKNTLGSNEGTATPLQQYVVNRNYIFILKKHGSFLNIFCGSIVFGARMFYTMCGLIILRRWAKLQALLQGIKDGMWIPI